MSLFQPKLLIEVTTFCCTFIFFLFHLANKNREILVDPNEYLSKLRDVKLDNILNGSKLTSRMKNSIINSAYNKHLLIPYCGRISLVSLLLFIIITYLDIKKLI